MRKVFPNHFQCLENTLWVIFSRILDQYLAHFRRMLSFPCKQNVTSSFLKFSGTWQGQHWHKMSSRGLSTVQLLILSPTIILQIQASTTLRLAKKMT